jgi:putative ABC transport system ATP-binding protein
MSRRCWTCSSRHLRIPDIDHARPIIEVDSVSRVYRAGAETIWALREVSFSVEPRQFLAITGPSGSGKTTLLNVIATIDRPTAGRIEVAGNDVGKMNNGELTHFRATTYGIVFQDPHLLPGLTALENVVAGRLPWKSWRELRPVAMRLLERVGLGDRVDHPPSKLSGGERQRVAIARALLGEPPILLADEPTGNLDAGNTRSLLALLGELRNDLSLTVLVGTHDPFVASAADRIVNLRPANGSVGDLPEPSSG